MFTWGGKKSQNSYHSKKNKIRKLTLTNPKTYYNAVVIKKMLFWQKNRKTDCWNLDSPEIEPLKYLQLKFNIEAKAN